MERDIVIVRQGETYRLVHGHLRLANTLKADGEAWIEMTDGNRVRIVQTSDGYLVTNGAQRFPLVRV